MHALDERILAYDRKITALAKQSEPVQRLMAIEGIGPITATAEVARVGNAQAFKNGRQFAAWLGLTPRQNSKRWQDARRHQQAR
ncbi:transposase [Denitratisoma oestradiolicum]|uniref:Transposase n=1 Tax=Denitratisoma oestradiolicum TaxID=311182 RepID=A0A6S6XYU0_9PROT